MTQEEIIKKGNEKYPQDIIEIINDDGFITREDVNFKIRKAYMEGLIDNNIPLPSGLDKVAEKIYPMTTTPPTSIEAAAHYNAAQQKLRDAFKTGAEWHARQGQTFESVVWQDSEDGLYVEAFVDESKFKMADNVLIQVIKKD